MHASRTCRAERGGGVPLRAAARPLRARASAGRRGRPGDPRLVWRSAGEVALAEWDEVAPLLDTPLEVADYVVVDLETTGTRAGVSRIVEIGGRPHERPQRGGADRSGSSTPAARCPPQITQITGIAPHHVRGRPRVRAGARRVPALRAGAVLVAHNARFDIGVRRRRRSARLRSGRLAAPVIDTVALARRLLGDRLARIEPRLAGRAVRHRVAPCHRALPDALATAEVLLAAARARAGARRGARWPTSSALCAPQRRRARTPARPRQAACRPARAST